MRNSECHANGENDDNINMRQHTTVDGGEHEVVRTRCRPTNARRLKHRRIRAAQFVNMLTISGSVLRESRREDNTR